jgi:hypothetical protein
VFASESFNLVKNEYSLQDKLILIAVLNSFAFDYLLRQKVSANVNMFYIYQSPAPKLPPISPEYWHLLSRTLRLTCTSREFAKLYNSVLRTSGTSLKGLPATWTKECGATDPAERLQLRAELDAIIAHVYGLTEVEFAHILSTFPIVKRQSPEVIDRTMAEFQKRV